MYDGEQQANDEEQDLIANWKQQIAMSNGQQVIGQGEADVHAERQDAESFGTGSFTTNTFNAKLAGSHGMQILKYIQSEEFGKYGESIKLIANINVSSVP